MIVVVAAALAILCIYLFSYIRQLDDKHNDANCITRSLHNIVHACKRVPWSKLRIPIVVMQLLTQFMSITGTQYPSIYGDYLKWLDIINLNISWFLSIGCILHVNFYAKLLVTTLAPLVVVAVIGVIHLRARYVHRLVNAIQEPATAPQRSFRTDALQHATAKHVSAFLTFTFLIYSTVSTVVFQTFACDYFDDTKRVGYVQTIVYHVILINILHTRYMLQ
jgi:hypothetical protein